MGIWDVVNKLESQGKYLEVMEYMLDHAEEFGEKDIYRCFKEYQAESRSFRLPEQRREQFYGILCPGETERSYHGCVFAQRGEDDQISVAEEMVQAGFIDYAIRALNAHCDNLKATKLHFKLGELYEKKGDFQTALRLYMNFNLVDRAVKCYEQTGDIDKAALYLLGEGKAGEGLRFYERAGRQDRVDWFRALTEFDLARFEHPLRSLTRLTSEKRVDILERVGDKFNARLEELRSKNVGRPKQEAGLIEKVREDIAKEEGYVEWLDFKPFLLLNTEAAILHRLAGDSTLERETSLRIDEMKKHAAALEGKLYQHNPMLAYVASGQFGKAIIVGEDWVMNRAEEKKGNGKNIIAEINVVAHSYEMIGAFSEAATWISRLISEWEKESDGIGKNQGLAQWHRWMSRVYLKMGQFSKAAESYLHYSIQEDGGSESYILPDRIQNYVLAGELYLWGGDSDGWNKVIKHVVRWSDVYLEQGLSVLAKAAGDNGFHEEAAKIWDQIGGKSNIKKATLTTKVQGSSQEAADHNVDETPMLICSCGEVLQSHWKQCPSCGKSVEMMCSCGEALKACWKLCPACGRKITA